MQILIKSPEEGELEEWSIIELQGELHANLQANLEGAILGDMHYTKKGEPMLIIGHHVLTGKVSKFEKPLAIMELVKGDEDEDFRYEVRGLVKKKLLFSERPRPIVASTETQDSDQQNVQK